MTTTNTLRVDDAILELKQFVDALRLIDPNHEGALSPLIYTMEMHVERLRDAHEAACDAGLASSRRDLEVMP
jgi:hypothetical protein